MTLDEVREMDSETLIVRFYFIVVKGTHEINSRRGFTKKTEKEEKMILNEIIRRFGLDEQIVWGGIDK